LFVKSISLTRSVTFADGSAHAFPPASGGNPVRELPRSGSSPVTASRLDQAGWTKYASSMIKTYNVGEAKTQLSSLLDEVQRGVEVIIAKNGKPVARVTKIEGVGKRPMGFVKGRLTRAFFEPLPDEELAELG
jgi:prevent-host-death family protein